jgi:Fis family transcriptional regulator
MILEQVEPPLLRATLRYCDNNQSRAAEILGLNRATLRKKLRQHRITAKPAR